MKNKVINKIINRYMASLLAILLVVACNDDFMDRFPETSISPEAYFKTVNDLQLYTNTYYTSIVVQWVDLISDNIAGTGTGGQEYNMIYGNTNVENVGGWTRSEWGELRKYNLFLENAGKVSGLQAEINHYIGFTRLQRAIWYYEYVKKYSDVPWYSRTFSDVDEDMLNKARDPRTLVVDSIMADLDYAVRNMLPDLGNRTRVSRWYAAAMMARICLHEGTFRKYHPELNLQATANTFLNKAVEAAEIVMNSGQFDIVKTGGKDDAYKRLFDSNSLNNHREMILFKGYDNSANIRHNAGFRGGFYDNCQPTRSMMESYQYIMPDGKAVPFSTVPDYDKMNHVQAFKNRDPRFTQTFMSPGYIIPGFTSPYPPQLSYGGYHIIKFLSPDPSQWGGLPADSHQWTDLPVFRYAELLLIFAEAKAELGTLTQADLDKSINLIRGRVDLPPTLIGQIVEDATLKTQFPGVSDYLILEIRRERRVELAYEQKRWNDLMRWKAGHLIVAPREGMYIDHLGVFDVNGDGVPTMGVFESVATNTVPEEERSKYSFYYLNSGVFSLTNGTSGHIVINADAAARRFNDPQFYYFPIPRQQIILNSNLQQTLFWD